jgi:hypothetical protein
MTVDGTPGVFGAAFIISKPASATSGSAALIQNGGLIPVWLNVSSVDKITMRDFIPRCER